MSLDISMRASGTLESVLRRRVKMAPWLAVTVVVSAQQALQVLESTDAGTFQLILSVRHCLRVSNVEIACTRDCVH